MNLMGDINMTVTTANVATKIQPLIVMVMTMTVQTLELMTMCRHGNTNVND